MTDLRDTVAQTSTKFNTLPIAKTSQVLSSITFLLFSKSRPAYFLWHYFQDTFSKILVGKCG